MIAATVQREGWCLAENVLSNDEACKLRKLADRVLTKGPGRRNLLGESEEVIATSQLPTVRGLIDAVLGLDAIAVRAILFDKAPDSNWGVPWHQDLNIAVAERREVPGFGPWTVKQGVTHVVPPREVLDAMLTIRLNLDNCDDANGPLLVLPGTHRHGPLTEAQISDLAARTSSQACLGPAGSAVLMRPLLVHSSRPAQSPAHRRVLHIEYAAAELPGGLQWAFAEGRSL